LIETKFPITNFCRKESKRKSYIVTYVQNEILKKDACVIGSINGQIGSGKSFAALRLCENVDPFFNIDRVTFSISDFAKLMRKPYPKGSAFLIEEAQVSANNLEFWSKSNKGLYKLLSTLRLRNYFTLFTLPNNAKLDSSVRTLFQLHVTATGFIDRKINKSMCTFYFPSPHAFKNNVVYRKNLMIRSKEGRSKCKKFRISQPSADLLKDYDRKKRKFVINNIDNIAYELEDTLIARIKK